MSEEIKEVMVEETKEVIVEEPKVETKPKRARSVTGFVANCLKLNIRKGPSKDAEILQVVEKGAMLVVNPGSSTEGWYKVRTESGVKGFCMKDFVTIE